MQHRERPPHEPTGRTGSVRHVRNAIEGRDILHGILLQSAILINVSVWV
jgi:hypothetical protein